MSGDREAVAKGRMARAWRAAARDLQVRFESPYAMEYKGTVYWCSGWLPDFGGPLGAIIAGLETAEEIFDVADALGYFASGLNPLYYECYDRESFIETLNDWGWFGDPANAPTWFVGFIGRHGGP